MDRGEQTLAPEWLKASGSSSHSDEHNTGTLPRNRLAVSGPDHDAPRASSSLSFRRSASSNGSMGHDKDSNSNSRAYSSFSRSHRDRDRDRDRHREREKDCLMGNGYNGYSESSMVNRRAEKDSLRRSQSMVSGRRVEPLTRRMGSDLSNGILSSGSSGGGLSKVSFEKDFPSLGAEDRQGVSEVVRVSSPGFTSAINSPHISPSSVIADGWTSALAEVHAVGGAHGPSALQTAAAYTASSTNTGLSMAEALTQAPARARTAAPLSSENERRKELILQQYNKLIPVTSSGPKSLVLGSLDKSKLKGARNGDLIVPKISQQSSSQLVNHAQRLPTTRPEIIKSSQPGNLLVLNREKNGISPSAVSVKDGSAQTIISSVPSALSLHLKTTAISKLKANGTGVEKKPISQDKIDFFNSLRKQAEMKNGVSHPEPSSGASSSSSSASSLSDSVLKLEENAGAFAASAAASSFGDLSVVENGNSDVCGDEADEIFLAPNEEEKAFLESLGWNENGGEGALTAEEIASFVKKHEDELELKRKLKPDFKYKAGLPESRRSV